VVELLLGAGADAGARDCLGGSALLDAAKAGHHAVIDALTARGTTCASCSALRAPGALRRALCGAPAPAAAAGGACWRAKGVQQRAFRDTRRLGHKAQARQVTCGRPNAERRGAFAHATHTRAAPRALNARRMALGEAAQQAAPSAVGPPGSQRGGGRLVRRSRARGTDARARRLGLLGAEAAGRMCTCVHAGDLVLLRNLMRAGIDVSAARPPRRLLPRPVLRVVCGRAPRPEWRATRWVVERLHV